MNFTLTFSGLNEEAEEKAIEEAEQKAESSYIKSSICDYWKGNKVRLIFLYTQNVNQARNRGDLQDKAL